MSDEGRPLPQRERGATEAGAGPAATAAGPPALTDDLRQRMQAAVDAERAQARERVTEMLRHPPQRRVAGVRFGAPTPDPADPAGSGRKANGKRQRAGHSRDAGQPAHSSVAVTSGPNVIVPELDHETAADAVTAEPVSGHGQSDVFSGPLPAAAVPAPGMGPGHPSGPNSAQPTPPPSPPVPAPARDLRPGPVRHRRTRTGLTLGVVAMLVAASVVMLTISHKHGLPTSKGSSAAAAAGSAAQVAAVSWVVGQVDQKTVVACDKSTCTALVARGYPPNKLLELGSNGALTNSSLVVVTPAARNLFGSSLVTAWAPSALASFGAGGSAVSVRVVAPKGAAAYRQAASRDQAQRTPSEAALTQVRNITVSGPAAQELRAGLVDGRLFEALANAAAAQPIDIVDFGNAGSGASPDVPLRYADLATANPNGSMTVAAYVASLRGAMGGDNSARPDRMRIITLPGGQQVLRVEFLAPSPFGVLGGT